MIQKVEGSHKQYWLALTQAEIGNSADKVGLTAAARTIEQYPPFRV